MKNVNDAVNFDPIEKTQSELRCEELLAQIYMGKDFDGTDVEKAFCKKMLTNKQGSVGVEEVLCKQLGFIKINISMALTESTKKPEFFLN